MNAIISAFAPCFLAAALGFSATIPGVVRDPSGAPVVKAYVRLLETGEGKFTDSDGRFQLETREFPVEIEIVHPSYKGRTILLTENFTSPLELTLEPKRSLSELVVVTANEPGGEFSPVGAAATTIEPALPASPPSTLGELVEAVPGVAENGQGGLFQTYSVRGISRQRVLTTISGVHVTSERRAGVSASFLDPLLMESVELLRGPSSSYHGSGALGGVVQIVPRRFEGMELRTGFESQGMENFQAGGWGNRHWSAGFVRRDAGNAEAADGSEINSHFTQYSAVVQSSWTAGNQDYQVMLLPTLGRDLGKANTDFPEEATNYPEEKHLIARFAVQSRNLWQLQAYVHPHDLHTQVKGGGSQSDVFNDTVDMGFGAEKQIGLGSFRMLRLGFDYYGRRGVNSRELSSDPASSQATDEIRSLHNAREDEAGLHASINVPVGPATFEGGGRFSWISQSNEGFSAVGRAAWNGFAGVALPLAGGFELSGSLGSGLRVPSITERYYTGTTGRGSVIGNPLLEPERSLNVEAGLRWYGRNVFAAGYLFRNQIYDYIERVELEPDLLTFVNLLSGTISGFEFEAVAQPVSPLQIYGRGHVITGNDEGGAPLVDIPVPRLALGARSSAGRLSYGAELELRGEKSRPGSGEKKISSAQVLNAFTRYNLYSDFQLHLSASNLLNQAYFSSADRKVPFAQGRSFAVSVVWSVD